MIVVHFTKFESTDSEDPYFQKHSLAEITEVEGDFIEMCFDADEENNYLRVRKSDLLREVREFSNT